MGSRGGEGGGAGVGGGEGVRGEWHGYLPADRCVRVLSHCPASEPQGWFTFYNGDPFRQYLQYCEDLFLRNLQYHQGPFPTILKISKGTHYDNMYNMDIFWTILTNTICFEDFANPC